MRFSDVELGLIKGLFANNDDLIFALRKVFLQKPLSDAETAALTSIQTPEGEALIRKIFRPTIDGNAPLFQLTDPHIGLYADMKNSTPDVSYPVICAKKLELKYVAQCLDELFGKTAKDRMLLETLIEREPTKTNKELIFIELNTWNYLLAYIDSTVQQIRFLAGSKEETVEETKERLEKNSNK